MPSTREKQNKQVGEEILELLSKPTAKERSLVDKFKSEGGAQVMEFCPHGTRTECERQQTSPLNNTENYDDEESCDTSNGRKTSSKSSKKTAVENSPSPSDTNFATNSNIPANNSMTSDHRCNKLHFKKIIQSHTDETLGDCSFLNTCFHMDTCKYVHYEVDSQTSSSCNPKTEESDKSDRTLALPKLKLVDPSTALHPAQWIQCDLRFLDMTVLGKFAVIMADPPWDIHMELPYGTMSDDEMRQLGVPALQGTT